MQSRHTHPFQDHRPTTHTYTHTQIYTHLGVRARAGEGVVGQPESLKFHALHRHVLVELEVEGEDEAGHEDGEDRVGAVDGVEGGELLYMWRFIYVCARAYVRETCFISVDDTYTHPRAHVNTYMYTHLHTVRVPVLHRARAGLERPREGDGAPRPDIGEVLCWWLLC